MTVEEQLRDYKATLDAATESAAEPALPRGVSPIRIRPARTLLVAAVAVAATIAVAFAAVGVARRDSSSPAGVNTPTTPTSASSPITAGPVRVPNVVGMKLAEAEVIMHGAGIHTLTAGTNMSCTSPPNIVARQSPEGGHRVASNRLETLVICNDTSPANSALPVVSCPTDTGTSSSTDPTAPPTVTIATPPFTSPILFGFSDSRGLLPITAPAGWSCKATDATDGGVTVGVTPPGVTPRDSWGVGSTVTQPSTDGVFAMTDPACQGCVYGEICNIVPSADADFPDYAHSGVCAAPPVGQQVTPLGNNLYRIDDPAGALGPDAAHSMLRYAPKTATTDASATRETCILPAAQADMCTSLLNQFLALNPSAD